MTDKPDAQNKLDTIIAAIIGDKYSDDPLDTRFTTAMEMLAKLTDVVDKAANANQQLEERLTLCEAAMRKSDPENALLIFGIPIEEIPDAAKH